MKKLFLIFTLAFSMIAFAQDDKTITVIASGDGITKDKATNAALRNCIEKTLGVFISASTEVKNDELVKEQIATVASGNILDYEIISETHSNENYQVTVSAKISPEKVVTQLNAKGNVFEVKGNVFAQNAFKEQFYKEQELIVIEDFFKKYEHAHFFDFDIEVLEPLIYSELSGCDKQIESKYDLMMNNMMDNIFEKRKIKINGESIQKLKSNSNKIGLAKVGNASWKLAGLPYLGGEKYKGNIFLKYDSLNGWNSKFRDGRYENEFPHAKGNIYYLQILAAPNITQGYIDFITSFIKLLNAISIKDVISFQKVAGISYNLSLFNLEGFIPEGNLKEFKKSGDLKFNLRNNKSIELILDYSNEIYLKSTVLNLTSPILNETKGIHFAELPSFNYTNIKLEVLTESYGYEDYWERKEHRHSSYRREDIKSNRCNFYPF